MGTSSPDRYVRSTGLDIPFYSVFTIDYMTLEGDGKDAIGTCHTDSWNDDDANPQNRRFNRDFIAKYGYRPHSDAAQADDTPFMLDDAIRAVGGDLTYRKVMMERMAKAEFPSIRGKIAYNINHFPIQNYYKREVVAEAEGEPEIVMRDVVFENHKDAYYED